MARIRSIHPEQWVDEDFVTITEIGRLLAIGLRNFADDNGVFEWKPLKLRMQILPADNTNMDELLAELVEKKQVVRYQVDGRAYGLIRNFKKFQKPKFPKAYYPLPTKDVPNRNTTNENDFGNASVTLPDNSRNSPADGESYGVGEGKKESKKEILKSDSEEKFERFKSVYPDRGGKAMGWSEAEKRFSKLVQEGIPPNDLIGAAGCYHGKMANVRERESVQMANTFLGTKETWREFIGQAEQVDPQKILEGRAWGVRNHIGAAPSDGNLRELLEGKLVTPKEAEWAMSREMRMKFTTPSVKR